MLLFKGTFHVHKREREAEDRGKKGRREGEGEKDLWQLKTRMAVIGALIWGKKKSLKKGKN